MAYWVKNYESLDQTYTEDGDSLDYVLKTYEGPFRTLDDVHNFLEEQGLLSPVEVLEFES
jgi:hypothetical protein